VAAVETGIRCGLSALDANVQRAACGLHCGENEKTTMTVKRNKSSQEGKEFWEAAAQASKTVESWPAWKRGVSTVATKEETPAAQEPPKKSE
jgi:hypothetical protein